MSRGRFPKKLTRNKYIMAVAAVFVIITTVFGVYEDATKKKSGYINNGEKLFCAHFIDVGQGDACLVSSPDGKYMLIDTGTTESSEYLVKYLKDAGVSKLDYLILSHPHEDHYGGADEIIYDFDVEKLVIHKDFKDTYPYNAFIYELENKNGNSSEVVEAEMNDKFEFADCAEFMIISPEQTDIDDYNESSLVIKLVYENTSYLFTGDAGKDSERKMMKNGYNLKSDVLKVGHHGSSTSSSDGFLNYVSPKYAFISCGEDNSYGHPNKKTLERLSYVGANVIRTDESGDIIIASDGKNIEVLGVGSNSDDKTEKSRLVKWFEGIMEKYAA